MTNQEIRGVLTSNEALLVHFNTPMSRHARGYPYDLRDAIQNPQWGMCYSTVKADDVGPTAVGHHSEKQCGSIGLVVDIGPSTTVERVCYTDGGSDGRNLGAGFGDAPTFAVCQQSILNRPDGYNEWFLTSPILIGVFTFPNPDAFISGQGAVPYLIGRVPSDFPDLRIFTLQKRQFYEYDRVYDSWMPVPYSEIYS